MGTPINLGRVFGVYLRLDVSLLLLAAFWGLDGLRYGGLQGMFDQLTFSVLLFACIFLHEVGHATAAAIFGISTLDVTLTFFGGYARLSRPTRGTLQEVTVSFAGPAMNLTIAGVLYLLLFNDNGLVLDPHSWTILGQLYWANLVLGIFNLLPGYPLDGGHIARSVLANFMPNRNARIVVGYIGVGVGFLLVALALRSGGIGLNMFVGFLLIWAASMEIQAARSSRF
jgi:stage IV sporulation protein FB